MTDDKPDVREDEYEGYLSYRKYLQEAHQESARSFDRTLFALSAGALGLSLAFIEDLPDGTFYAWLLGMGWTCLGLSLLTNLLSIFLAERDFFHSLGKVDKAYANNKFPQEIEFNRFEHWVPAMNLSSLVLAIVGVGLLIAFTFGRLGDAP